MDYKLEIDGTVYKFRFGLGFAREISKTKVVEVDGEKVERGLYYAIAGLFDGDYEMLINILLAGNSGADGPKLDRKTIEAWMDSDAFDLDKECTKLLDFFGKSSFTKKATTELRAYAKQQKDLTGKKVEYLMENPDKI